MENAKSSKGCIPTRFVMIQGFKLGNKLADKKEHNKSGGKSPTESHRKQLVWVHMVLLLQKDAPCRRSQAGGFGTLSVRTPSNSIESRAEPWVLPLSFPLGRGGYSNWGKKIFLVMSKCERGKS